MMATWSQSEDSSDDESENEFSNMCFMAFEDQDKVSSDSKSKKTWVEKSKVTNHQGPKKIWVPKSS